MNMNVGLEEFAVTALATDDVDLVHAGKNGDVADFFDLRILFPRTVELRKSDHSTLQRLSWLAAALCLMAASVAATYAQARRQPRPAPHPFKRWSSRAALRPA